MAWEDFKKKLFGPYVYWNLIAMVLVGIALCIGLWVWMNWYTKHGESVEVPEVKGMMISDAEYALEELNLVTVVVDSAYVRKQPAGIVLEQKPAPGSKVKSGREIYLTINHFFGVYFARKLLFFFFKFFYLIFSYFIIIIYISFTFTTRRLIHTCCTYFRAFFHIIIIY